ncbi:MAG: sigma-70 family RNA polymerase sigma factor [Clostridia bacterium]|nr:sigma-70 family RNA polymerase sigma factor [Clostridia bacterium]
MKNFDPTEQKDLILRAKQGKQGAFERLLENYRPLISSLVKSTVSEFPFSDSDYEDLYQEAVILFFRALNRYDTDQGEVAFGLFAKICIRNGLLTQAKRMQKRLNTLSLENEETTLPPASEPSDRLIEQESYEALYESIRRSLTEYENRVWWLYLSGRTAREIALALKKDEKSVQNAIYRIRRKLRTIIPHS